jgi:hypothetical protein
MTGMKCFQRFLPRTPVPGCLGGEDDGSLADYCVWIDGDFNSGSPPTPKPTAKPSPEPTQVADDIPPEIDCDSYDVNYNRMCKRNSCCENPRSSSLFCHEEYAVLGDAVPSACYHCCMEEMGENKIVGPAPEEHPEIEKTIGCESIENPERMCKEGSCCDESGKDTNWCEEQYGLHRRHIESICVSLLVGSEAASY